MKKYLQLNKHDPENGVIGDCFRTAIGCLLNIAPDKIPNFLASKSWLSEAQIYLKARGLTLVRFAMEGEDLNKVMSWAADVNPDAHYILVGESKNKVNHCVICRGGKIIHDPSQDQSGIIGPCIDDGFYWLEFLALLHEAGQ